MSYQSVAEDLREKLIIDCQSCLNLFNSLHNIDIRREKNIARNILAGIADHRLDVIDDLEAIGKIANESKCIINTVCNAFQPGEENLEEDLKGIVRESAIKLDLLIKSSKDEDATREAEIATQMELFEKTHEGFQTFKK